MLEVARRWTRRRGKGEEKGKLGVGKSMLEVARRWTRRGGKERRRESEKKEGGEGELDNREEKEKRDK